MPFAQINDAQIHYQFDGPENAPVLVFSNSLGSNLSMWDAQVLALSKNFRILRYDTRGHGQSSATPGPYSIEQLAKDVLSLLDFLHLDRVNFCGLSMGGATGQWLGANAPEYLHKLILANTTAKFGTPEPWNTRIALVQKSGTNPVGPIVIERWFTSSFRQNHPASVEPAQQMLENTNPEGYIANCAAVRDFDSRKYLQSIHIPTLVIAGTHDPSTTPAEGQFLAQNIPGARYVELPAAHLSNIEARDQFNTALASFLSS
jgi:3-oxoadipate enol-lactonase